MGKTSLAVRAKLEHLHTVADSKQTPDGTTTSPTALLTLPATESALHALAHRSLFNPDDEENAYVLVPMVADFLRRHRPEVVRKTGNRLEHRTCALIVENGWGKHDRFPLLDAACLTVAPALPVFLAGENARLQTVCDALAHFLNFTGRWDEWISLIPLCYKMSIS